MATHAPAFLRTPRSLVQASKAIADAARAAQLSVNNGVGTRLTLPKRGPVGERFAAFKDGYFQVGSKWRLGGAPVEIAYGQAPGYGWNNALTLTATELPLPGLAGLRPRLTLVRQGRDSGALFTPANARTLGGRQHVGGSFFNLSFCWEWLGLALPLECNEEKTVTLRQRGLQRHMDLKKLHADAPLGQDGPSVTAQLARWIGYGAAASAAYDQLPTGGDASRTLRHNNAFTFGINFDKWLSKLQVRARHQRRENNLLDISHRAGQYRTRFEYAQSQENRVLLALANPSALAGRVRAFFHQLLPQLSFGHRTESKFELDVSSQSEPTGMASWGLLAQQCGKARDHLLQLQAGRDVRQPLQRAFAELQASPTPGRATSSRVQAIAVEAREEARRRVGASWLFLPLRGYDVSPSYEIIDAAGVRQSVARRPQTSANELREGQLTGQFGYETYGSVAYEYNYRYRLNHRTEVRSCWRDEAKLGFGQLKLQSTWTFNPRSESKFDAPLADVTALVRQIGQLFNLKNRLHPPTTMAGERKLTVGYTFSAGQLAYITRIWASKPFTTNYTKHTMLPEAALRQLHGALRHARTPAAACAVIEAFVTGTKVLSADYPDQNCTVPHAARAIAALHGIANLAPRLEVDVSCNKYDDAFAGAKAVAERYAHEPLDFTAPPSTLLLRRQRLRYAAREMRHAIDAIEGDAFFRGPSHDNLVRRAKAQHKVLTDQLQQLSDTACPPRVVDADKLPALA